MNDKQWNEIAEGEAWLARFEAPAPRPEALAAVKQAVRRELKSASTAPVATRWQSWHGALAAAAVLAMCVTVGWRSMVRTPSAGPIAADVALWPAPTENQALTMADLEAGLSELEAWPDQTVSSGTLDTGLYDALEDVLTEPASQNPAGTSSMGPFGRGATQAA